MKGEGQLRDNVFYIYSDTRSDEMGRCAFVGWGRLGKAFEREERNGRKG